MFIVLEGLDGSGKGTLAKHLSQTLGLGVVAFPTKKTRELHSYLEGKVRIRPKPLFLLFLYDILQHLPEEGDWVVDRYVFSTIAYGRGLALERAKAVVEALEVPRPRAVLYLRISVETALKRSRGEHIYDKDRELLSEVWRRYEALYREQFLAPWYGVDGEQPLERVLKEGEAIVRRLMEA